MNSQITSTVIGCQIFGGHMLKVGKGSIINISSASAGPLRRRLHIQLQKLA